MQRFVQFTEVTTRDFAGKFITTEAHINTECLIAVKPVEADKSLLVLRGTSPITVMGTPSEIISRVRAGYVPRPELHDAVLLKREPSVAIQRPQSCPAPKTAQLLEHPTT